MLRLLYLKNITSDEVRGFSLISNHKNTKRQFDKYNALNELSCSYSTFVYLNEFHWPIRVDFFLTELQSTIFICWRFPLNCTFISWIFVMTDKRLLCARPLFYLSITKSTWRKFVNNLLLTACACIPFILV